MCFLFLVQSEIHFLAFYDRFYNMMDFLLLLNHVSEQDEQMFFCLFKIENKKRKKRFDFKIWNVMDTKVHLRVHLKERRKDTLNFKRLLTYLLAHMHEPRRKKNIISSSYVSFISYFNLFSIFSLTKKSQWRTFWSFYVFFAFK